MTFSRKIKQGALTAGIIGALALSYAGAKDSCKADSTFATGGGYNTGTTIESDSGRMYETPESYYDSQTTRGLDSRRMYEDSGTYDRGINAESGLDLLTKGIGILSLGGMGFICYLAIRDSLSDYRYNHQKDYAKDNY